MDRRFAVGDKVRVIDAYDWHEAEGVKVGDVATVIEVADDDMVALRNPKWSQRYQKMCFYLRQIEPATTDDGIQAIRDAVTKAVATATPAQVIAAASALGLKVEQQTTYRIVT